ncbi:unnamed protein product [Gadus morhua 'NCC']
MRRQPSPPPWGQKPGEVEKEARARVISEGGDPGNPMLVLGCHSIQLGKYQGQTLRWPLENDVGYASLVVACHQRDRETSASDNPLMANKDSLARYSCAQPAFAEHLYFRREQEEARPRATLPGRGGEALVGFGLFKEDTLKDQRPSVPPPPTEVTDEELVRMLTDVEMGNWHHTGRVAL